MDAFYNSSELVPEWIPDQLKIKGAGDSEANQSQEKFSAEINGGRSVFSMHNYRDMYKVPWLYDTMMFSFLNCQTPQGLARELKSYVDTRRAGADGAQGLRILEVGAGSGAFAVTLRAEGLVQEIVGLDILDEARLACERDRPYVYDDYIVDDLTNLSVANIQKIRKFAPNCVAVASATGWGNHIPVSGFQAAFDLLEPGGLFLFHVKPEDPDPECRALVRWFDQVSASVEICDVASGRIYHRKSVCGEDIQYTFYIGKKRG